MAISRNCNRNMCKLSICTLILLSTLCNAVVELPADYESKTAEAKLDMLFDEIKATEGTRGNYPSPFGYVRFVLQDDLSPTCDHFSDIIPYKHEKRIHSVGPVAKMVFESNGEHPYTGLFQGASHGLIRLSMAQKPSRWRGTAPGMGAKLFRNGMPSANFVAMFSLDGQDGGNFFENNFSNHVNVTSSPILSVLANKFAEVSAPAEFVGLSDIAAYTEEGVEVDEPVFPFELVLLPNRELQTQFADSPSTEEGFEEILAIPVGTKLYDVYARATPAAPKTIIGMIKITSELMYSSFGDENLFFRHQRFDDDLALRPEWKGNLGRRGLLRKRCPLGLDGIE